MRRLFEGGVYSRAAFIRGNTVIGRPLNSISVHPHVEFLKMEAVLKHPEKTLAEIAHEAYVQTGSQYTLAGVFSYLRRNRFSRKKVSPSFFFFCPLEICPHANCFNVTICDFFSYNRIALQRSEQARVNVRSNVCTLEPEMFVFLDGTGFVRVFLSFIKC